MDQENIPSHRVRAIVILSVLAVIVVIAGYFIFREGDSVIVNTNTKLPEVSRVPKGRALKLTFYNPVILEQGHYKAWVVIDDDVHIVDVFLIGEDGKLTTLGGESVLFNELDAGMDITNASEVYVTIEPDSDNTSSDVEFLRGSVDFETKRASLTISAATFEDVNGRYVIATPTDGINTNERSGIWFITNPAAEGSPTIQGLHLPVLQAGWIYEGWVKHDEHYISTGRFTDPAARDQTSTHSGTLSAGPAFPGEDFIHNAPVDIKFNFPFNLTGGTSEIIVTIEPDIEGSDPTGDEPFDASVLYGFIPDGARIDVNYDLTDGTETMTTATATLL